MKNQKTKSARKFKEETVKSLAEKIERTKTLIFADYHGLTALQINDLRRKIKAAGGELVVVKNTLLARALANYQLPASPAKPASQGERGEPTTRFARRARRANYQLTGPTASIFAYEDEVAPTKAVADVAKTLGVPKFKFGFFGRNFIDQASIELLAKIPSLPELNAQVVGTLSSPIYNFVYVLWANIRNLVLVLDQVAKTKGLTTNV